MMLLLRVFQRRLGVAVDMEQARQGWQTESLVVAARHSAAISEQEKEASAAASMHASKACLMNNDTELHTHSMPRHHVASGSRIPRKPRVLAQDRPYLPIQLSHQHSIIPLCSNLLSKLSFVFSKFLSFIFHQSDKSFFQVLKIRP